MKEDPAIEEVRAARLRISKRFGHDTKALLDHYRELEKKHPERMLKKPSSEEKPEQAEDQEKRFPR
jgi:hypothetical protein